jgi:hypothetical protein
MYFAKKNIYIRTKIFNLRKFYICFCLGNLTVFMIENHPITFRLCIFNLWLKQGLK